MSSERIYLFVNDAELTVWRGEPRRLTQTATLQANAEGVAAFEQLLESQPKALWHVLFDLQEEDYRIETIPHVGARDRNRIVARRLDQLYRESHYRSATPQGRESGGRRDDRMLLAALTNPAPLDIWLKPLAQRYARLVGVYSISLLVARHAHQVASIPKRALITSRQAGSGLRQTYLADGTLRFSRLTPLDGNTTEALASQLVAEATRARQFLASLRAIDRNEALNVVLLCSVDELPALQSAFIGTELIHYVFVTLNDLASAFDVTTEDGCTAAEPIWLRFIARKKPQNQYATLAQRKSFLTWQAGRILLGIGTLLLLVGLLGGAYFQRAAKSLDQQTQVLNVRHIEADKRYQLNISTAKEGDLSPTGMKNVVHAYQDLVEEWPQLQSSLLDVSHVMMKFPVLELDELGWMVSNNPQAVPAGFNDKSTTAAAATAPSDPGAGQAASQRYLVVGIKGRLSGYAKRYREALALVDDIAKAFVLRPNIQVEKIELPIDIRPESAVDLGSSDDNASPDASFALKFSIPLSPPTANTATGMAQ